MKLVSIQFPSLPMFGNLGHVRVDAPPHQVRQWIVAIRGPAVFLVSPPGWTTVNQPIASLPVTGPRRIFEVARALCVEQWEGSVEEVDAVTKYTSEPMDVPKVISDEELERATAPKQKVAGR